VKSVREMDAYVERSKIPVQRLRFPCSSIKLPCSVQTRMCAETVAGRILLRSTTTSGRAKFQKTSLYFPINREFGNWRPVSPNWLLHHAFRRSERFPGEWRTAPNWRRMPPALSLCKRAVGFGRPFRRFCLWPSKSRFLAAALVAGRDPVRIPSYCGEVRAPDAGATTRRACRRDGRRPFREVADLRRLP
jgi:hypothetical protein